MTSTLDQIADISGEMDYRSRSHSRLYTFKSADSKKMALNIFSTGTMIKSGKVYKNYMVDFQTTNNKLHHKALHIIMEATCVSSEETKDLLKRTNGNIKTSIVIAITGAPSRK